METISQLQMLDVTKEIFKQTKSFWIKTTPFKMKVRDELLHQYIYPTLFQQYCIFIVKERHFIKFKQIN